jgi:predicted transcriptional regulator of viral defense system
MLWDVALDQYGLVTAAQARELGVGDAALSTLARRGTLERIGFGVYRFPDFPEHRLAPYMAATLWPHGPRGVLSDETALDLYEVSDVNPSAYDVTVPRAHRVQRKVPAYLRLHRRDLAPEDLAWFEGIPIVTLERAIRDVIGGRLGRRFVEQAIDDGARAGLIAAKEAARLRAEAGLTGVRSPG